MLTPQQVEQFETDGYLVLDPCLAAGEAEALRSRVRQIAEGDFDFPEDAIEYEPMAMVTAWVALDDVTEENGCLYVVPGSHRLGAVEHSEPWMVGDRRDMKIPDAAIDWERERPIELGAGGCSFHHGLVQHRSGPNLTDRFRRGLATHYMTSRSQWTGDPNEQPPYELLHGREYEGCV